MKLDPKLAMKVLAPKLLFKVVQTFDRTTTIVVSVTWGAAILMMVFAIYVMSLSASSKRAVDVVMVTEPSLPKIAHSGIDAHRAQQMVERMQNHFPGIKFNLLPNMTLSVSAADGSLFREWLNALSFIDTITPEYHWSIQQFCVGRCPNNELMHAILSGEALSFQMPQL